MNFVYSDNQIPNKVKLFLIKKYKEDQLDKFIQGTYSSESLEGNDHNMVFRSKFIQNALDNKLQWVCITKQDACAAKNI